MAWYQSKLTHLVGVTLIVIFYLTCGCSSFLFEDDNAMCTANSSCQMSICDGDQVFDSQMPTCQCQEGTKCPIDKGTVPEQTVIRHIGTKHDSPLLVLKYCKPLYTEKTRICKKNEVTMSFQGSSLILSNVANVYCRCPEHGPIFLSSSITKGVTKIENYTCFMPTCDVSDIDHSCSRETVRNIMTVQRNDICRCPKNHTCKLAQKTLSTIRQFQCQPDSHSV